MCGWFLIENTVEIPVVAEIGKEIPPNHIEKRRTMMPESNYEITTYDYEFSPQSNTLFIGYTDSIKTAKAFLFNDLINDFDIITLYCKEGHDIHKKMTAEEAIKRFMPSDLSFAFVDKNLELDDGEDEK
jgi:hypothetical protein